MRVYSIIDEKLDAEYLALTEERSFLLWENAGIKIQEAALTAKQIQDLFQQIEKGETASGSNRTLIGKGKDVADAVKTAYDDLVSKVQNSGPVQNVDAKYDQIAAKLKQATGGDQGVMKYVQKYRDFAKEHPIAQSFIYAALIAAAGISGVGAGGAAALGLLKMADKLLQGEKFSTAVGKGLATGATAYAAGQIGKAMQGGDQTQQVAQQAGTGLSRQDIEFWKNSHFGADLDRVLNDPSVTQQYKDELVRQLNRSVANPNNTASVADAWRMATRGAMIRAGNPYGYNESIELSERQIRIIFGTTQGIMLQEGVWDSIKSGAKKVAGAVADKAKTVGHNLTTKVTADKLNKAWKDAGSPTDSNEVAAILKAQGVSDNVISSVYSSLNLPTPVAQSQQTDQSTEPADQTQQATSQTSSNTTEPAVQQTQRSTAISGRSQILKNLEQRISALEKQLKLA